MKPYLRVQLIFVGNVMGLEKYTDFNIVVLVAVRIASLKEM